MTKPNIYSNGHPSDREPQVLSVDYDGWITYGQVNRLAGSFEDHLTALSTRRSNELTADDRQFIELAVQNLSEVVLKGVGKYELRLPGFITRQDQMIVHKLVNSVSRMSEIGPLPKNSITSEGLRTNRSEWVRLGAIVTSRAEELKLATHPDILTPMEDYALYMAAVVDRFAAANNGIPMDEETVDKLKETISYIK